MERMRGDFFDCLKHFAGHEKDGFAIKIDAKADVVAGFDADLGQAVSSVTEDGSCDVLPGIAVEKLEGLGYEVAGHHGRQLNQQLLDLADW